jgi:hypothetical protein
MHDRHQEPYGAPPGDPWGGDIISCGAELAVAKLLNQHWTAWARRPGEVAADVGTNIQVRRRRMIGWDLITHPKDPNDHFYVLVWGELPTYIVVGYLRGWEAKREDCWNKYDTGRPAFFTAPGALRPIGELCTPMT